MTLAGPAAADRQPARRQPGRDLRRCPVAGGARRACSATASPPTCPASTPSSAPPPLPRPLDVAGAPDGPDPGRVADRRGHAVRQALRRRPGRRAATLPAGLVAPVRLTGLPPSIADGRAGHRDAARRSCAGSRPGTGCGLTVRHLRPGVRDARRARPSTRSAVRRRDVTLPHGGRRRRSPIRTSIWRYVLAALVALIAIGLAVVVAAGPPAGAGAHATAGRPRARRHPAGRARAAQGVRATASSPSTTSTSRSSGARSSACSGPTAPARPPSLRMLMGLTRPTAGRDPRLRPPARCPARRCCPGSARSSRARASCRTCPGCENLRLYWAATGRPGRGRPLRRGAGDRRARRRRSTGGSRPTATACGSASPSRRPCSACPSCSCSTSRPTGSTRRRSPRCARCCSRYADRRPGGPRLQPPAGRGRADLHPRRRHAPGRGRRGRAGRGDRRRLARPSSSTCPTWTRPQRCSDGADGRPRRSPVERRRPGRRHRRHARAPRWWRRWCAAGVGVDRVVPRRRLEDAFLSLVGERHRRPAVGAR